MSGSTRARPTASEPWQIAPPLLEDIYTMEDALLVGAMVITLLRHADRVKMACMAQLVNVIAPIMTQTGGTAWRQTIFYPYLHGFPLWARRGARCGAESPTYHDDEYDAVPYLEAVATWDETANTLTLFAVNRSLDSALPLEGDLRAFPGYRVVEHIDHAPCRSQSDQHQRDRPDNVRPQPNGDALLDQGMLTATLPAASWNVIRLVSAAA